MKFIWHLLCCPSCNTMYQTFGREGMDQSTISSSIPCDNWRGKGCRKDAISLNSHLTVMLSCPPDPDPIKKFFKLFKVTWRERETKTDVSKKKGLNNSPLTTQLPGKRHSSSTRANSATVVACIPSTPLCLDLQPTTSAQDFNNLPRPECFSCFLTKRLFSAYPSLVQMRKWKKTPFETESEVAWQKPMSKLLYHVKRKGGIKNSCNWTHMYETSESKRNPSFTYFAQM